MNPGNGKQHPALRAWSIFMPHCVDFVSFVAAISRKGGLIWLVTAYFLFVNV